MTDYVEMSEGWMHPPEMEFIRECVRSSRAQSKLILEVGCWKGRSTSALANEGFVFCVDWFHGGLTTPESNWTMPEFVNNMDKVGALKKTVILPMVSTEALPLLRQFGIRFGTVFLDADHTELSVERDLELVWPLLESGGLLIVDDYEPAGNHPGVIVAADKFMKTRGLAIERCVGKDISIRKP